MKNRSEVFSHFCAFCAEIKTQFNISVRTLRSDNGKEYMSNSFQSYMTQHGILHQSSCVDTPSQNGVAERKNRHLLETARALLFQMKVPKQFWADAISTACFLINRMPSTVLNDQIPYSILFPKKSLFPVEPRIFGSTCYVRDVRPSVTKLDPKALKFVQEYSRHQETREEIPAPTSSLSDPPSDLNLPIGLRKGKHANQFIPLLISFLMITCLLPRALLLPL